MKLKVTLPEQALARSRDRHPRRSAGDLPCRDIARRRGADASRAHRDDAVSLGTALDRSRVVRRPGVTLSLSIAAQDAGHARLLGITGRARAARRAGRPAARRHPDPRRYAAARPPGSCTATRGRRRPFLTKMAAEGATFDRAYSQAGWTKVSATSFLTSLYPTTHGVAKFSGSPAGVGDDDRRGVSRSGLRHVRDFVGAVHRPVHEPAPGRRAAARGRLALRRRGRLHRARPRASTSIGPQNGSIATAMGRSSCTFTCSTRIRRTSRAGRTTCSGPIPPSATRTSPSASRCARRSPIVTYAGRGMATREEMVKAGIDPAAYLAYDKDWYDSAIRGLDAELARLFERLRAAGVDRDTLIVLISDHGEEFQDHGRMWHGQSVYGEMVHVPLVVRWPARVPAGARVDEPVQLVDVMPTLLGLSRLTAPAGSARTEHRCPCCSMPGGAMPAPWKRRPVIIEKLAARWHRHSPDDLEATGDHRRRVEADSQPQSPGGSAGIRAVRREARSARPEERGGRESLKPSNVSRRPSTAGGRWRRRRG